MLSKEEDYNSIPVLYCRRCLSLLIMEDEAFGDYCKKCGSTDIGEISIEEWENLYNESLKEPEHGKGKSKSRR